MLNHNSEDNALGAVLTQGAGAGVGMFKPGQQKALVVGQIQSAKQITSKGVGLRPTALAPNTASPVANDVIANALPAGGKDVLLSAGLPAEKDPSKAELLSQSLGSPTTKAAITAQTLADYADAMIPALSGVSQKSLADLRDFTTKMKAWSLLSKAYFFAANERDAPGQIEAVTKLVNDAVSILSSSKAKADASTLVDAYKEVKAAQVAYWKAQMGLQVQFPLYEFRTVGTNTTQASWFGSVAMRPEVASSDGKYPVADCFLPKIVGERNPDFYAQIPGLADYLPYSAYPGARGINLTSDSVYADLYKKGKDDSAAFDSAYALMLLSDQWRRLYNKPFNDDPKNFVTRMVVDFVNVAIEQDPEWDASAFNWRTVVKGVLYVSTLLPASIDHLASDFAGLGVLAYVQSKRAKEVLPKVCGTIAAAQQAARGEAGALFDARKAYLASLSKMRTTIILACGGVPPVPVQWTVKGSLLQPSPDWSKWQQEVSGPASLDLETSGKKFFSDMGAGFVPFVLAQLKGCYFFKPGDKDSMLAYWSPDQSVSPWAPSIPDYSKALGVLTRAQGPLRDQANSLLSVLTPLQKQWATSRAAVKSALLVAARLAELGLSTQSTTDTILGTLSEFAMQLYGKELPVPPADVTPEQLKDWYSKVLTEAAKNPTPDSLAGKVAALQAEYNKTHDPAILKQIDDLKSTMEGLVTRRVRRRGLATSNVRDDAGSTDLATKSTAALNRSGQSGVGMTEAEKNLAAKTNATNQEVVAKDQKTLAYVAGSGDALNEVIGTSGLTVSPTVQTTLEDNKTKAESGLPQVKQSSGLLLWLAAAGAAYAATRK
jgi:hypothetical protein